MRKNEKLAAIVLAAGKGVRMKSKKVNKVMIPLAGHPMISYTVNLLKKLKVGEIVVVVGFAKDSVENFLGPTLVYAEQKKRLGTAHAVGCALEKIPSRFREMLVLNGDDSAFYQPKIIKSLIDKHYDKKADLTLLTIETKNPYGLGRVLRNQKGEIFGIVEEKDASETQRKIKEINPACYLFRRTFFKKYLPKVKKSSVSGEYYLTDLVRLGFEGRERIEGLKVKDLAWRGINTWEELRAAEKIMRRLKHGN